MISLHSALFSISVGYTRWCLVVYLCLTVLHTGTHLAPILLLQVSVAGLEAPGVLTNQQI